MIDFTYNPIIPADYKSRRRHFLTKCLLPGRPVLHCTGRRGIGGIQGTGRKNPVGQAASQRLEIGTKAPWWGSFLYSRFGGKRKGRRPMGGTGEKGKSGERERAPAGRSGAAGTGGDAVAAEPAAGGLPCGRPKRGQRKICGEGADKPFSFTKAAPDASKRGEDGLPAAQPAGS